MSRCYLCSKTERDPQHQVLVRISGIPTCSACRKYHEIDGEEVTQPGAKAGAR